MIPKTYDYIITLKSSKGHFAYDLLSQLMLFTAAVSILYAGVSAGDAIYKTVCIVFSLLIVAKWIHTRIAKSDYRVGLIIAAVSWYYAFQHLFTAILFFIAAILERQVKFRREIGFDETGLTFNTLPKKKYRWDEVSNVVLKDGMLTVDLYNNKIIQRELDSEYTSEMEAEFNEFCRSNLFSFQSKQ